MNRSITNVLFGGIAAPAEAAKKMEGVVTKVCVLMARALVLPIIGIDDR
jgi:hypothetical protein